MCEGVTNVHFRFLFMCFHYPSLSKSISQCKWASALDMELINALCYAPYDCSTVPVFCVFRELSVILVYCIHQQYDANFHNLCHMLYDYMNNEPRCEGGRLLFGATPVLYLSVVAVHASGKMEKFGDKLYEWKRFASNAQLPPTM